MESGHLTTIVVSSTIMYVMIKFINWAAEGAQFILEIRVSQHFARLGGEAHKMSGMEGGKRIGVNCVTGY